MKMKLRYLAAALRVGYKRGKIKRSKKLGVDTGAETSGEQGWPGGLLQPGWGPKQIISVGDDAISKLQIDIWTNCVNKGKLKLADLFCLLTDLTALTLTHEYVHTQQLSALTSFEQFRTECEAYKLNCGLMTWFLAELPKYNGTKKCTLGFEMRKQLKICKANMEFVCGS